MFRITGSPAKFVVIIKIVDDSSAGGSATAAGEYVGAAITIDGNALVGAAACTAVSLVSALENHISGFTSLSDADYEGINPTLLDIIRKSSI